MTRSVLLTAASAGLLVSGAAAQSLEPGNPALVEAMRELRVEPSAPMPATNRGAMGGTPVDYLENFQTHPVSTDPVFDRYQVILQLSQPSPIFEYELFNVVSAVPSLVVDGQTDPFGTPDPLPRWQGTAVLETAQPTTPDFNNDGVVDTADLGILIADFGETGPGFPADLNGDEVVDTADLGALISAFGGPLDEHCVYQFVEVYPRDDHGFLLPPGTLDNGPFVGDQIAVDASEDCGLCDDFRLTQDGTGVDIFGRWTLVDAAATDLSGVEFFGDVVSADCPDLGDDRALALIRGETGIANTNCCFQNVRGSLRGTYVEQNLTEGIDLVCEMDIFIPSLESFIWTDFTSNEQALTMSRLFLGGPVAGLSPEFFPFANGDGLLERFVLLGPGPIPGSGSFYGTVEDPDYVDPSTPIPTPTPLPGKLVIPGEWFTIRHIITSVQRHEVWIKDSETMALVDPMPGDNGRSTATILDDIEDGFARIYPAGPFGRMERDSGVHAQDPAPPVAASTASTFRALYGNEDILLPRADRNQFIDNVRIQGMEFPLTPAP